MGSCWLHPRERLTSRHLTTPGLPLFEALGCHAQRKIWNFTTQNLAPLGSRSVHSEDPWLRVDDIANNAQWCILSIAIIHHCLEMHLIPRCPCFRPRYELVPTIVDQDQTLNNHNLGASSNTRKVITTIGFYMLLLLVVNAACFIMAQKQWLIFGLMHEW